MLDSYANVQDQSLLVVAVVGGVNYKSKCWLEEHIARVS